MPLGRGFYISPIEDAELTDLQPVSVPERWDSALHLVVHSHDPRMAGSVAERVANEE
ncbi:hypothetical protein HCH54_005281 [Aspergillus fumigatus]